MLFVNICNIDFIRNTTKEYKKRQSILRKQLKLISRRKPDNILTKEKNDGRPKTKADKKLHRTFHFSPKTVEIYFLI